MHLCLCIPQRLSLKHAADIKVHARRRPHVLSYLNICTVAMHALNGNWPAHTEREMKESKAEQVWP